ncbi:hypothetical protein CBE37_01110 [bacterium TMED277]|nr:MAG: hypothetical protein CBE37_01110 [bacterium TMED277]
MKKLILFDYDGTLVDSADIIVEGTIQAFVRCGLPKPDPRKVKKGIGHKLITALKDYIPKDLTIDPNIIAAEYRKWYQEMDEEGIHFEPIFEGVHSLLDFLKRKDWLLGIATNKSSRGLFRGLKHHKIEHFFDLIMTSDDFPAKPKPDMALNAQRKFSVEGNRSIMIGDTVHDIVMGNLAKCVTIGVTWGYNTRESLIDADADFIADEFDQLSTLLKTEKILGEKYAI